MDNIDSNKKNFKGPAYIIGILSGKGGVGKSTVTSELALSLTQEGYRVGILDGDVYGPSMRHLLPEETPPKRSQEKMTPALSQGISVMSVAYFPKGKRASIVRAPIASQIISQFIDEVEWGELDFLLVDFPPGTGDVQITLMQKLEISGALIITTPQELSILDVRKSIEMCLEMEVPLLGILENMSYFSDPERKKRHYLFGKGGALSLAKEFEVPLLGEIPIDQGLNHSGMEKISLPLFKKLGCAVALALKEEKRCKIKVEDRYHFSIEWLDGKKSLYVFNDVQRLCPCIECLEKKQVSHLEVEGLKIVPVGKYGIQVIFSKGCSKGIYPFSYLRKMDR